MEPVIAAVDIGATKVTVSLIDMRGFKIRLHQSVALEGDETTIPKQVIYLIDECIRRTDCKREALQAVGVSTAGPFDKRNGKIGLVSPNICGGMAPERDVIPNNWTFVPLQEMLEESLPGVVIENDAVSGAQAERAFGSGRGYDNILYVTWSTGIGTGAIVDGRVIRGKNGNAPHGGHIYMREEGPRCGCGNIADLEAIVSGTAIARSYGDGRTTKEVFEAFVKGDIRAIEIIEDAAKVFGRGLASMNCILDTSIIIIGGSVLLNNKEILLPKVRETFYRSFPVLSKDVQLIESGLGKYLGDLAALSLVISDEWMNEWLKKEPWKHIPETQFIKGANFN